MDRKCDTEGYKSNPVPADTVSASASMRARNNVVSGSILIVPQRQLLSVLPLTSTILLTFECKYVPTHVTSTGHVIGSSLMIHHASKELSHHHAVESEDRSDRITLIHHGL